VALRREISGTVVAINTRMSELKFLSWDGTVRPLGTLWTLERAGRRMTCELRTHPFGWELLVMLRGELRSSETVKAVLAVMDLADKWRGLAETEGWTRVRS
jgi:hypothetical protein